jgi:integrase
VLYQHVGIGGALRLEKTRHGRRSWYVRFGNGPRIRIKAEYGTPEFDAAYQAALRGEQSAPMATARTGSLEWLIARYRETTSWQTLSPATKRQRENIFGNVIKSAGKSSYRDIKRATIVAGRDRRAATPAQSRNFLDAMRGLFRWALDAGLVPLNPTEGIKNPPRPKGDGFRPWTEDDVTAYEKRWQVRTRQRVWLDVLLYTGLRRGDVVRLGRQHVRDGVAMIKTEKTGTAVTLPILPVLAKTLAAGPCGDLTFIAGASGRPFTKESFGNEFREACRAAGVPGSAHGVRKIAATRAANAGATVAQLEAIFGWQGGAMASLYTRAADRRRLALEGMHMLANNYRTSIAAPSKKVRRKTEKE